MKIRAHCRHNSSVLLRCSILLVCLFGLTTSLLAQVMNEEMGNANPFISVVRKASNDFPGAFPVLSADEPDGSLVVASGDFHNSDISIIVEKNLLDGLKPKVMDLLARLGLKKTYVRVRRGRVIGSFDLEFKVTTPIHLFLSELFWISSKSGIYLSQPVLQSGEAKPAI